MNKFNIFTEHRNKLNIFFNFSRKNRYPPWTYNVGDDSGG